jgi:hypothetical protein
MFKYVEKHPPAGSGRVPTIDLGAVSPHDPWSMACVARLEAAGYIDFKAAVKPHQSRMSVQLSGALDDHGAGALAQRTYATDSVVYVGKADVLDDETLVDELAELLRRGGTPYPLVFDKVRRPSQCCPPPRPFSDTFRFGLDSDTFRGRFGHAFVEVGPVSDQFQIRIRIQTLLWNVELQV